MKICFNPNLYPSKNVSHKASMPKSAKIGFSDLDKITSEAEYDNVLNSLKNSGKWFSGWNKGDKFETGIMPYVGSQDISYEINCFLRDKKDISKRYPLEDIIRVMNYALTEIDKRFGKFKGIVYRYGFVDNVSKNYLSTARNPEGAVSQIQDRRRYSKPFYIIQTESAHKIEDVQKKLKYNPVYIEESEILIDPTHFMEVKTLTPELEEAKVKLISAANKERLNPPITRITFLQEI